jgi:hypothetical protein
MATPAKSSWASVLLVAAIALAAYAYVFMTSAGMPDVAATHFNVQGEPNAMSSRAGYRGFMAILILGIPLLIAGLPIAVSRRWPQLLNIPHPEHWLARERIEDTMSSLRTRMAVVAVATIVLQCFVHRLVLGANAADSPELDQRSLLIGLSLFGAFMLGWIISLWRRFRKIPDETSE